MIISFLLPTNFSKTGKRTRKLQIVQQQPRNNINVLNITDGSITRIEEPVDVLTLPISLSWEVSQEKTRHKIVISQINKSQEEKIMRSHSYCHTQVPIS